MKKGPAGSQSTMADDILANVELELTSAQLAAIRLRASTRRCSEEEYVRRLFGDAMIRNALATNFGAFDEN